MSQSRQRARAFGQGGDHDAHTPADLWVNTCAFTLLGSLIVTGCAGKTWNHVALGDSTPDGYGVDNSYIEEHENILHHMDRPADLDYWVRADRVWFERLDLYPNG